MQYTRVVAIEYPRSGIWTLGFITGEAMHDIQNTVDEPVVSAFVPHSPMPFTGFAVTVKKSETVDLSISVDQAIQFVISCGVVIPPPPGGGGAFEGVTPRGERLQLSGTTGAMANLALHPRTLRLGTRGSQLARWQAEWVADELRDAGHTVELIEIATHGDVDRARPIEEIGTRGVFTKAIQQALLENEVDLAVHSLKDLPTEPVEGLMLAAVPKRESPADVLVCRTDNPVRPRKCPLPSYPRGASWSAPAACGDKHNCCIGGRTCNVAEVRGNVETRLRKLDDGAVRRDRASRGRPATIGTGGTHYAGLAVRRHAASSGAGGARN